MDNENSEDNKVDQQAAINTLLIHAIEHQPKEFQAAFNDLLTQKIMDRVDAAKQEVAQNYFNYEEQPENESEEETEEQTDEVEQNGQDAETV